MQNNKLQQPNIQTREDQNHLPISSDINNYNNGEDQNRLSNSQNSQHNANLHYNQFPAFENLSNIGNFLVTSETSRAQQHKIIFQDKNGTQKPEEIDITTASQQYKSTQIGFNILDKDHCLSDEKLGDYQQLFKTPEKQFPNMLTAQSTPAATDQKIQSNRAISYPIVNAQSIENKLGFISNEGLIDFHIARPMFEHPLNSLGGSSKNNINSIKIVTKQISTSSSSFMNNNQQDSSSINNIDEAQNNNPLPLASSSQVRRKSIKNATNSESQQTNQFSRTASTVSQHQRTPLSKHFSDDNVIKKQVKIVHTAGSGPYLNQQGKSHHHPNCKGLKQGRWTKDEHFRFLEALKLFGKEWRKVQQHVCTRTSTQARSHAQKFFVKVEKRNQTLDEFLGDLDLQNLEKHYIFSDLEEEEEYDEGQSTGQQFDQPHIVTKNGPQENQTSPQNFKESEEKSEIQSAKQSLPDIEGDNSTENKNKEKLQVESSDSSGNIVGAIFSKNEEIKTNKRNRKRAEKEEVKQTIYANQQQLSSEDHQINDSSPRAKQGVQEQNLTHISSECATASPSKSNANTRRKSVMALGFNSNPTRGDISHHTTYQNGEIFTNHLQQEVTTKDIDGEHISLNQFKIDSQKSILDPATAINFDLASPQKQNKTPNNYYNQQAQDPAAAYYNNEGNRPLNQFNELQNSSNQHAALPQAPTAQLDRRESQAYSEKEKNTSNTRINHSILQKRLRGIDENSSSHEETVKKASQLDTLQIQREQLQNSCTTGKITDISSTNMLPQYCFKVVKNQEDCEMTGKNKKQVESLVSDQVFEKNQDKKGERGVNTTNESKVHLSMQEAAQNSIRSQPKTNNFINNPAMTPNLKYSNPSMSLFESEDQMKRSNSFRVFDCMNLPHQNPGEISYNEENQGLDYFAKFDAITNHRNRFGQPHYGHLDPINPEQVIEKMNQDYNQDFTISMAAKENNYRNIQLPFRSLSANDYHPSQHQIIIREQRNSFDLLEIDSKNLLEMTGGDYQDFIKEKKQIKDQQQGMNFLNQHPLQLAKYQSAMYQNSPNLFEAPLPKHARSPQGQATIANLLPYSYQNFSTPQLTPTLNTINMGHHFQQNQFSLPISSFQNAQQILNKPQQLPDSTSIMRNKNQ